MAMTKRTRTLLSYYLMGISIGLFLLAIVHFGKRSMMASQQQHAPDTTSPSGSSPATASDS